MLGSIILTGGLSTRMGADKADLIWGGRRAIDWIFDLAVACGAEHVVTVGARNYNYSFVPDLKPHSGPVGGVLAGAEDLVREGVDRLLVLAVDAPTITPSDVAPLLASPAGAAYVGLHLPFVVPTSSLPSTADPSWPLARLLENSGIYRLPAPTSDLSRLRGANTPEERRRLVESFKAAGGPSEGPG